MSLRPIPKLDDQEAMARLGRASALRSARLDALHELRDCVTYLQSNDRDEELYLARASECIERLEQLARIPA